MGGGGSKQKKASVKVDVLQERIDTENNEKSAFKKELNDALNAKDKTRSKSQVKYNTIEPKDQYGGGSQAQQMQNQINMTGANTARNMNADLPSELTRMRNLPINHGSNEDWGELNETSGSRRERIRLQNGDHERRIQTQMQVGNGNNNNEFLNDQEYENLLNEAIIQSILEQDRLKQLEDDSDDQLDLQEGEEEKQLKEVLQLSSLEHKKQTGGIDLNHLKRKNKKPSINQQINPDDNNTFTEQELSRLANFVSPTASSLAPVQIGKKLKNQPSVANIGLHQQSSISIMQSLKTNDQTMQAMENPSQSLLQGLAQQEEEDSLLKDFNNINKRSPFRSKAERFNDVTNSHEFEMSSISSPNIKPKGQQIQYDKQLEKVINEQQQKNHEEDWNNLIDDIDKNPMEGQNSSFAHRSPNIKKHSKQPSDTQVTVLQSDTKITEFDNISNNIGSNANWQASTKDKARGESAMLSELSKSNNGKKGDLIKIVKNSDSFAIISQSDNLDSQVESEIVQKPRPVQNSAAKVQSPSVIKSPEELQKDQENKEIDKDIIEDDLIDQLDEFF